MRRAVASRACRRLEPPARAALATGDRGRRSSASGWWAWLCSPVADPLSHAALHARPSSSPRPSARAHLARRYASQLTCLAARSCAGCSRSASSGPPPAFVSRCSRPASPGSSSATAGARCSSTSPGSATPALPRRRGLRGARPDRRARRVRRAAGGRRRASRGAQRPRSSPPLMALLDGRRSLRACAAVARHRADGRRSTSRSSPSSRRSTREFGLAALAFVLLIVVAFTYMARLVVGRARAHPRSTRTCRGASCQRPHPHARRARPARRAPLRRGRRASRATSPSTSGCPRATRSSRTPPACCTTSASSRCPTASWSAAARSTDADWRGIRRHPDIGADLLRDIGVYGPVAEIVRAHHERIDGRGYPRGLRATRSRRSRGSSRSPRSTTRSPRPTPTARR